MDPKKSVFGVSTSSDTLDDALGMSEGAAAAGVGVVKTSMGSGGSRFLGVTMQLDTRLLNSDVENAGTGTLVPSIFGKTKGGM